MKLMMMVITTTATNMTPTTIGTTQTKTTKLKTKTKRTTTIKLLTMTNNKSKRIFGIFLVIFEGFCGFFFVHSRCYYPQTSKGSGVPYERSKKSSAVK